MGITAEVDEAGPGLVFVAGSSVVPGIIWRFQALGGREPSDSEGEI